eukprot:5924768-Lingulodinium_polyedra.AAC.1
MAKRGMILRHAARSSARLSRWLAHSQSQSLTMRTGTSTAGSWLEPSPSAMAVVLQRPPTEVTMSAAL